MRSSGGQHYVGLDHLRALAAFLVFERHFLHTREGLTYPMSPGESVDLWAFPLGLLYEGYAGVALFMTLSGYLFAKLLDGKTINFSAFLFNRALRLAPLLVLVMLVYGVRDYIHGRDLIAYAERLLLGFVMPTWPSGGWSIAVELHFYLLLPLLLWLSRRGVSWPTLLIVGALSLRAAVWSATGEVQSASYWTILGRLDQFVGGMLAYQLRRHFAGDHIRALVVLSLFALHYWWFGYLGGFHGMPSYPSPTPLWIFMPTIDAIGWGVLIAWYDGSFRPRASGVSGVLARIGECSYSIYLWHFFFVFAAARYVNDNLISFNSVYAGMAVAALLFVCFVPFAWASYVLFERPFLSLRRRYQRASTASSG